MKRPRGAEASGWRAATYLLLLVGFGAAAVWVRGVPRVFGHEVATFLEVGSTVLALVVGALALVRYHTGRRSTFLYLGTGFLGTAVLDAYHALVLTPALPPDPIPPLADPAAWSWLASRLLLSVFLAASGLAWLLERNPDGSEGPGADVGLHQREEPPGQAREIVTYLSALALTVVILVFLQQDVAGPAYRIGGVVARPWELVPAIFFAAAVGGSLGRGSWRREPFDHWLVCSLLAALTVQVGFVALSQQPLDASELGARMGKTASYGLVLVGLLASVRTAFRERETSSRLVVEANQALAREVATRRQAEEVLQESEERLQDFLDHANDLIQSTDPEGRILYVNETWKRTLGYSDDDLEGRNILSVAHPKSRETFRDILRRVLRGDAVRDFEVVFQTANGEPVALAGSSNCRFEGGKPVATRTIFRDITEQARAEQELARSQANLRALFESTGDAIWSVDIDHRLVTFNTAFALTVEALTGRAPRPGDAVEDVVAEWEVGWFRNCYDRALAGNRFVAGREEPLGGTTRFYELYFHPFETPEGPGGVVVFSKDITRRREVEKALRGAKRDAEEANRAKSDFMASMSHELRTPLNSVIGFANLLLRRGATEMPARDREFLERILANGKHLLNLINQILDLSKIESGKMELEVERVDLRELVSSVLRELEGQVADRPVELTSAWNVLPRPLQTDRGKLKQVLINLVGNAIKFTEDGTVEVEIEADPDTGEPTAVQVRDTGIGIPEDRLQTIFEAFRQAEGSTSRRYGGTGLGLTISRSLCALMGHGLSVSSEKGRGSTFRIELNVGALPGPEAEPGSAGPEPSKRTPPGPPPDRASGDRSGAGTAPARPTLKDARGGPPGGPKGAAAGLPERFGSQRGARAPALRPVGSTVLRDSDVLVVDPHVDSQRLLADVLGELGCLVRTAASAPEALAKARDRAPEVVTTDLVMERMSGWELLEEMRRDAGLADVPLVMVALSAEGASEEWAPGPVDVLGLPPEEGELVAALRRNRIPSTGRALLVEVGGESRLVAQRVLREAGLVVHSVEQAGAAVRFVQRVDVDLILIDLSASVMEGFAHVSRLRAASANGNGPAVFFLREALDEEALVELRDTPAGIIYKDVQVAERLSVTLSTLLGGSDPPDAEGSAEPKR